MFLFWNIRCLDPHCNMKFQIFLVSFSGKTSQETLDDEDEEEEDDNNSSNDETSDSDEAMQVLT